MILVVINKEPIKKNIYYGKTDSRIEQRSYFGYK